MHATYISAFAIAGLAAIARADFCPAIDGIPKTSVPHDQDLEMTKVTFTFKSSTPTITMDMLRRGLICRGAVLDAPDYNAKTISGYANKLRASKVTKAKHFVKADYEDATTTKAPNNWDHLETGSAAKSATESATGSVAESATGSTTGSNSKNGGAAPVKATLTLVAAAAAFAQLL
ncbi:hypothetical protein EC988_003253 [Linderina pennispora]|nr:hypothetical protein EC988_003252 [Linderina pennispora]KAJ1952989.1 hypothetical protein EC988_003253 [Linderina pennispora]